MGAEGSNAGLAGLDLGLKSRVNVGTQRKHAATKTSSLPPWLSTWLGHSRRNQPAALSRTYGCFYGFMLHNKVWDHQRDDHLDQKPAFRLLSSAVDPDIPADLAKGRLLPPKREGAPCACPQLPSSPPRRSLRPTAGAIPSTGPGAAEVARGRGCPGRARSSEPSPQSPEQRRSARGVPLAPAGAAGGSWAPGSDRLLMAAARVASSCDIHRWGGGENSFHLLLWSRD